MTSIRSNPTILASSVVIGLLLSWIIATFVRTDPDTHEVFTVAQTFIFSTWLSTVLAAITGTLMFTSEVQHGTLSAVVTAQPARWVTVVAKAAIAAGFGLAMGVLAMIGGFSGATLSGLDMGDTSGMAATALRGLMVASVAAVLGLGVGMIIRHSSAAVSTLLVWALVLENIVRTVAPPTTSRFLPFSAADHLLGIKSASDTAATAVVALSRVQDAFLYIGYAAAALVIGTVLLYRRDTN
ncbi:MAG: hypothetical protein ABI949_04740 [Ilumatobacteraceae bacterium]